MLEPFSAGRIPVMLWLDDAEEGALQIARDIANLIKRHWHKRISTR